MKIKIFVFLLVSSTIALFFYLDPPPEPSRETLMHYPEDATAVFDNAVTSLKVLSRSDEDEYRIEWQTDATLNQTAYLRKDVSLLFEDGRLKDKLSQWKEKSTGLHMEKQVNGEDSGYYESITIHTAELHYPNDITKSSRKMSYDALYVIDSPLSPLQAFKDPISEEEKESKEILDNIINQQLSYIWNDLITYYNIPLQKYEAVPITKLAPSEDSPLSGLTEEASTKLMSQVWNTLYKNYYLGLTGNDEKVISPIGSSVPLLLYTASGDHFIILFQTADGKPVQLLQTVTS